MVANTTLNPVPARYVPRPDVELVTIDEMASRLSMTRKQFQNLVRKAHIPKVLIGHRTVRYCPERVIAVVTEQYTTYAYADRIPAGR